MEFYTCEITEEKIVEAVHYALSNGFNLDELSRLLVLEGGVDLDTLARIIRGNRDASQDDEVARPVVDFTARRSEIHQAAGQWFGLKIAS